MTYPQEAEEYREINTGTFHATPRTFELINEVLNSDIISYGDKSREFEKQFAHIHQSKYGTLSNSGTSSLHIALQTLVELHRWMPGDEVIIPATTFVATANIVKHNQLTPVFVDVDPDYYNIDVTKIEEKITDRTRCIIPVHLFGQSSNMTEVMKIAKAYNLKVIEDSCEAMFVSHRAKMVGSMGDIGCFSMYSAHLLTAGVGGIAITKNNDYSAKMRSLVNHGLELANLNLDDDNSPHPMMNRQFMFDSTGHSFRLTEFEAAVALAQLEERTQMIKIRQRNGKHYTASLKLINKSYPSSIYRPAKVMKNNKHAYMMYPIVVNPPTGLDFKKVHLTNYLNKHGIETRHMLPLINQPSFSYIAQQDYPISKYLISNGFYVGCHQDLSVDDVKHVLVHLSIYANRNLKGN